MWDESKFFVAGRVDAGRSTVSTVPPFRAPAALHRAGGNRNSAMISKRGPAVFGNLSAHCEEGRGVTHGTRGSDSTKLVGLVDKASWGRGVDHLEFFSQAHVAESFGKIGPVPAGSFECICTGIRVLQGVVGPFVVGANIEFAHRQAGSRPNQSGRSFLKRLLPITL